MTGPTLLKDVSWLLFDSALETDWTALRIEERVYAASAHDAHVPARPEDTLTLISQGSAAAELWDETGWSNGDARTGAVLLMPADRECQFRWRVTSTLPLKTIQVFLPPALMRLTAESLGLDLPGSSLMVDPVLANTVRALARSARDHGPSGYAEVTAAFLAAHVLTQLAEKEARVGAVPKRRLLRLFRDAVGQLTSIPELCEQVGVSEFRLTRMMVAVTGETPWQYLLRLRLAEAKRLLVKTDLRVEEIASRCGFKTASHFAATFRRMAGVSPSQWRRYHS